VLPWGCEFTGKGKSLMSGVIIRPNWLGGEIARSSRNEGVGKEKRREKTEMKMCGRIERRRGHLQVSLEQHWGWRKSIAGKGE